MTTIDFKKKGETEMRKKNDVKREGGKREGNKEMKERGRKTI